MHDVYETRNWLYVWSIKQGEPALVLLGIRSKMWKSLVYYAVVQTCLNRNNVYHELSPDGVATVPEPRIRGPGYNHSCLGAKHGEPAHVSCLGYNVLRARI